MRSKLMRLVLSGAIALTSAGLAATADAAIVNIDSTSNTPVKLLLNPGRYKVEFIGKADGGAYDGWNPSCVGGVCGSNWKEAFSTFTDPGPHPNIDTYFVNGPAFSSALAALAAFQTSPIQDLTVVWNGSKYVFGAQRQIDQPWVVDLGGPVTVKFTIGDSTREDNFGGVSLRISAVPEPQVWSMMVLGFFGLGAVLRARRTGAATAA